MKPLLGNEANNYSILKHIVAILDLKFSCHSTLWLAASMEDQEQIINLHDSLECTQYSGNVTEGYSIWNPRGGEEVLDAPRHFFADPPHTLTPLPLHIFSQWGPQNFTSHPISPLRISNEIAWRSITVSHNLKMYEIIAFSSVTI